MKLLKGAHTSVKVLDEMCELHRVEVPVDPERLALVMGAVA